MGARMRVIAAVVPAATLLLAGGAVAGGSPAPEPIVVAVPLVERPSCFSEAPDPGEVPAGSTVVHLTVPRRVTVRLGAGGTVVAVATNTGCAPAPGDLFVVEGSERAATAAEEAATLDALGASGDWTGYGRFVAVP
jgi:hypothetical protein